MSFLEFRGNASVSLSVCDKKKLETDYGSRLENIRHGIRTGTRTDFSFLSWGFFFLLTAFRATSPAFLLHIWPVLAAFSMFWPINALPLAVFALCCMRKTTTKTSEMTWKIHFHSVCNIFRENQFTQWKPHTLLVIFSPQLVQLRRQFTIINGEFLVHSPLAAQSWQLLKLLTHGPVKKDNFAN